MRAGRLPDRDDPWWIEAPVAEICRPLSAAVNPVRATKSNPFGGWPQPEKLRKLRRPRVEKRCAMPGCDRLLWEGNRTGLCPEHVHTPGLCRCARCSAPTNDTRHGGQPDA